MAIHPGVVKTDLYVPNEESNFILRYLKMLFGPLVMQDVVQGAKNQLWAATAKGVESGAYYVPVGKKNGGSGWVSDKALAAKLWDWSEEQLKGKGYTWNDK